MLQKYDCSFIGVRTPSLPFKQLRQLVQTLTTNPDALFELPQKFISDPHLAEALYIASPVLYQKTRQYLGNPEKFNAKDRDRLCMSLLKYFTRTTSRTVPFGLFVAVGQTAPQSWESTDFFCKISPKENTYVDRKLDLNFLTYLYFQIQTLDEIRQKATYFKNPTLYKINDQWRYQKLEPELTRFKKNRLLIKTSPILDLILATCQTEAPFQHLLETLQQHGLSSTQSNSYLNELIDSQLILPNHFPNPTGPLYQDQLIQTIAELLENMGESAQAEEWQHQLSLVRQKQLVRPKQYNQTKNCLETLLDVEIPEQIFKADLFFNKLDIGLPKNALKNLETGVSILHKLNTRLISKSMEQYEKFREAFYARYENREVPILTVVDSETGIPFDFNLSGIQATRNQINWDKSASFKLRLHTKALQSGLKEVNITNEEAQELLGDQSLESLFNDSFYFMGTPLKSDYPEGFEWHIGYVGGVSASNIFPRFCHASNYLTGQIRSIKEKERQFHPDTITAELVYIPDQLGNIQLRPHLGNYEIPVLGRSTLPQEQQIPLEDIMIRFENNQLKCRSKKLNKDLRILSGSTYNPRMPSNSTIYKLLCLLQTYQSKQVTISWSWDFLTSEPFLPRIRYKNIILSPARWRVKSSTLTALSDLPAEKRWEAFLEIKQSREIPDEVLVELQDIKFYINLESKTGLDLLIQNAKTMDNLVLTEFSATEDKLIAEGPTGKYMAEFVLPFILKSNQPRPQQRGIRVDRTEADITKKRYSPGSQWLYYKLYTSQSSADGLLTNTIYPRLQQYLNEGRISEWFFIRYQDPEFHLRLRLKWHKPEDLAFIMQDLGTTFQPYEASEVIWKIQMDSYFPELERYGVHTMELCEKAFFYNSECVVQLIEQIFQKGQHAGLLFATATFGLDQMLNDFGMDMQQKIDFAGQMQTAYAREFNFNPTKEDKKRLSQSYRTQSAIFEVFFGLSPKPEENSAVFERIEHLFKAQSTKVAPLIQEIRAIQKERPHLLGLIIQSLLHMFFNRFFSDRARLLEFGVYELYVRFLKSMKARFEKQKIKA